MARSHPRTAVLIPAAGRGERMGGERKQFRHLGGETLLIRTLRLFAEYPRIDEIVVAVPRDSLTDLRRADLLQKIREDSRAREQSPELQIVEGGSSRQASVAAALHAAHPGTEIVLVHDAVRPFLPPDRIDAVIEAAARLGAAALAVPVNDTLRKHAGDLLGETAERAELVRMQTPQAFRYDWFLEAHEEAARSGNDETDDVALVQRTGRAVHLVEGSALNFKVTTPADWVLAQALWHYLSPKS